MAEHSRVTPSGWEQSDATEDKSRVTPAGWTQVDADEPSFNPAWAINSNQVIQ